MLVTLTLWLLLALAFFGAGYNFLRRRKALDPTSPEAQKANAILEVMPLDIRQALDDSILQEKQGNMIKILRKECDLNFHEALDVIQLAKAFHLGTHP